MDPKLVRDLNSVSPVEHGMVGVKPLHRRGGAPRTDSNVTPCLTSYTWLVQRPTLSAIVSVCHLHFFSHFVVGPRWPMADFRWLKLISRDHHTPEN